MTGSNAMETPLWQPSPERIERSNLTAFMRQVEQEWGVSCADYGDLYRWSVHDVANFWRSVWRFTRVIGDPGDSIVLKDADNMPDAQFFPDARLNYAENLLRRRDHTDAIVFW